MAKRISEIVTQTIIENQQTAQKVSQQIETVMNSTTAVGLKVAHEQLKQTVVAQQTKCIKQILTHQVQRVMEEVGFNTIQVKQISNTPVVVAKNEKGQTLRTEISMDEGKINLTRIHSGIPESECGKLNEEINRRLKEHGIEYEDFVIVRKPNSNQRIFLTPSISITNDQGDQKINNYN